MRIPRLFTPQPCTVGNSITLEATASHYLVSVLRMAKGRPLVLFDNSGHDHAATLIEADRKAAVVRIDAILPNACESPLTLQLAIGVSRGERFDWVVQKATELGVSHIQPLWTERVEVRLNGPRLEKKLAHWRQVATSACEQSGRARLPQLAEPLPLARYLELAAPGLRLVLDPAADAAPDWQGGQHAATLLIGPEGGLTEGEIRAAHGAGFQPWRLGPRVLRTETAPVAALAILQHRLGDAG